MTVAKRSLSRLAAAREDIRVLLTDPVMAWVTSPAFRRTDENYRGLLLIPVDLAAAGRLLQVSKDGDEWRILLAKPISPTQSIDVSARAVSWTHALHQLSISVDGHITSLESTSRVQDRSLATPTPERIVA